MSRLVSRRTFLERLGVGGLALPLLNAPSSPARAADAFPKRLVIIVVPSLGPRDQFWPQGGETDFTLPSVSAPLERFRSKLLFVGGLAMQNNIDHAAGPHLTRLHHLTGYGQQKTMKDGGDFPGGPSVDQLLLQKLPASAVTAGGVLALGADDNRISFRGAGDNTSIAPETDNAKLFAKLFAGRATGGNMTDAAAMAAVNQSLQRRQSVLDYLKGSLTSYQRGLGTSDRQKIDAHLTSLREVEKSLAPPKLVAGCQVPAAPAKNDSATVPGFVKTQLDLLAAALACDTHRIATVHWVEDGGEAAFFNPKWDLKWIDPSFGLPPGEIAPDDNVNLRYHTLEHRGCETARGTALRAKVDRWFVEQVAYFLGKLDAVGEGDGSLLDHCAVVLTGAFGIPHMHSAAQIPMVVAGSAGGAIKTGRWMKVGSHDDFNVPETKDMKLNETGFVPHNRFWSAICNVMGVPTEQFGDPAYNAGGPLNL